MGRRASKALVWVLITAAPVGWGSSVMAQAPAAAPVTLWNFLGIPQGVNKIKDATSNKFGNHPALERKPPLKRIGDPANLASKNPAIASAAQIKQEEDLAPQKIKAIKYLATIGCGCYDKKIDPPVKVALMAALDDCTERVRFEAAKAIGEAAATKCAVCGQNCCCDEDMAKKLAEVAFERGDDCCWLESSERVRNAAREALQICCRSRRAPPDAVPLGPSEVVPEEPRDVLPQPEQRDVLPMAPMPIPQARRSSPMPMRPAPQSVGATSRHPSNVPMAPPAKDSKPLLMPMPVVKTPAKMPTPRISAPANQDSAQQKKPTDKPVAEKPVAEKPSPSVEKPQVRTQTTDAIKKVAMTPPASMPVIKIESKATPVVSKSASSTPVAASAKAEQTSSERMTLEAGLQKPASVPVIRIVAEGSRPILSTGTVSGVTSPATKPTVKTETPAEPKRMLQVAVRPVVATDSPNREIASASTAPMPVKAPVRVAQAPATKASSRSSTAAAPTQARFVPGETSTGKDVRQIIWLKD